MDSSITTTSSIADSFFMLIHFPPFFGFVILLRNEIPPRIPFCGHVPISHPDINFALTGISVHKP
jgi:hypothetical protein